MRSANLNELAAALTCYDEAITIRRQLIEEGRRELRAELAKTLANKGIAKKAQDDRQAAQTLFTEAHALLSQCIDDGYTHFQSLLDWVNRKADE